MNTEYKANRIDENRDIIELILVLIWWIMPVANRMSRWESLIDWYIYMLMRDSYLELLSID